MNFDARTWYVNDYEFDNITVIDDFTDNSDNRKLSLDSVSGMFNISWLTPKNIGIAALILIELIILGSLVAFAFEEFIL